MKSEKLRYLKRIVSRLTANEKDLIHRYLGCFDTRGGSHRPKTLSLFELLVKHDDLKTILKKMPKALDTDSENAMRMIAHRLKEKIGECLLLDINVNREGAYEDVFKVKVDIAKKKQVSEIYRSRGLDHEKEQLYSKIIISARKYELFPELIETLLLKQEHVGLRFGRKQFDALEDELTMADQSNRAVINAKKAYYRTVQQFAFEGLNRNTPNAYIAQLKAEIDRLKHDFEHTSAGMVGYYLYLLQTEFFQVQRDFAKASEYCLRIVDVVRNNPAVYHKRRLGISYLNLSQNEIFNHYFDYSLGFAKEARKYFEPGTSNYNLGLELEFYAHFYDGNPELAELALEELVYESDSEQSEYRLAWRHYLMACSQFVQKRYKLVNDHLNETKALNKDKIGWNLGVRTLTIITAIEQENFDYADTLIISMQQFVKQALKGTALRSRDEVVLKLLIELRKHSYDFKAAVSKKTDLLAALASDNPEYSWQTQSPELIIFHKWFESKLAQEEYVPDYSKENVFSEAVTQ